MGAFYHKFIGFFAAVSAFFVLPAAGEIFSQYGQIQNVQNYSSNPFWKPNGAYNQRMPQPVYVQGADLNAGDCVRAVSALVASYCVTRNGCAMVSLDDARPTLMVQLAALPNHNYVGSCAGFIDSEFAGYKAARGNAAPVANRAVAFPDAVAPSPVVTNPEFEIKNPYAPSAPDWATDAAKRAKELSDLQAQNGAGGETLVVMDFPKTADDLTLDQKMRLEKHGFKPYKDKSGWQKITVGSAKEYWEDVKNQAANKKNALDALNGKGSGSTAKASRDAMIEKIAAALKEAKK